MTLEEFLREQNGKMKVCQENIEAITAVQNLYPLANFHSDGFWANPPLKEVNAIRQWGSGEFLLGHDLFHSGKLCINGKHCVVWANPRIGLKDLIQRIDSPAKVLKLLEILERWELDGRVHYFNQTEGEK